MSAILVASPSMRESALESASAAAGSATAAVGHLILARAAQVRIAPTGALISWAIMPDICCTTLLRSNIASWVRVAAATAESLSCSAIERLRSSVLRLTSLSSLSSLKMRKRRSPAPSQKAVLCLA